MWFVSKLPKLKRLAKDIDSKAGQRSSGRRVKLGRYHKND